MVQMGGDSGKIADAIAICVSKAAGINLIDDGAAPPGRGLRAR
jgi:hypothetical protein